jgi:hypothetical protein
MAINQVFYMFANTEFVIRITIIIKVVVIYNSGGVVIGDTIVGEQG